MLDTVTAFREIEVQASGLPWERLYYMTWDNRCYREPSFHPIRTSFNSPDARWEPCKGIPGDAENIGSYASPPDTAITP